MNELIFNKLPKAVSQLSDKLTSIEKILLKQSNNAQPETNQLLTIKQAGEFVCAQSQNLSGLFLKHYLYGMSINPYLNIETSSDFQVYEFESAGKENIKKRVR